MKLFRHHALNSDNLFQAYSRSCKNGEDGEEDEMGCAHDAEPNAKASPSSLQATVETGESKSSASSDTCSHCHFIMKSYNHLDDEEKLK